MPANPQIKRPFQESEYTPEMIRELQRCSADPVYFIENYVKVLHPKHGIMLMKLYDYQKEMIDLVHNSKDSLILASRQMGKCQIYDSIISTIERPKGLKRILLKIFDRKEYDRVFRCNSTKEAQT